MEYWAKGEIVYYSNKRDYMMGIVDKMDPYGVVHLEDCYVIDENGEKKEKYGTGTDLVFSNECFLNLLALKTYLRMNESKRVEMYKNKMENILQLLKFPLNHFIDEERRSFEQECKIKAYKEKVKELMDIEL